MPLSEAIASEAELKELVSVIDLTTLNPTDNEGTIRQLCQKAITPLGKVAAVCVYPCFVPIVKSELTSSSIRIASVANFPTGDEPLKNALKQIEQALAAGANEIDMVLPYKDYLQGRREQALDYILQCRSACEKTLLKVILEISEFDREELPRVSQEVIELGVNFIKTSTGKSSHGATLEGARIMLEAIKTSDQQVGFKASGGIYDIATALDYLELAKEVMGSAWVKPSNFRIGASKLLDQILSSCSN